MRKEVTIGNIKIGADNPIAVQTMYDRPLSALEENFEEKMHTLKAMGCDIIRFSYPDINEHEMLKKVVSLCPMPVVADIHFDYKNAIDALSCNVAKIRINPGNIGARWKTEEVVKCALDKGAAIRIGLNSGSLPDNLDNKEMSSLMVDTAMEYISWFENLGFYNTVVSLKASDGEVTYQANKKFACTSDYPLHLGVTEAGSVVSSCVRSTWALGRLLNEGIGSTIRYSITGCIEDEVQAGSELLRTLGLKNQGVRIVSCPMCGRKSFDSQAFLKKTEKKILACNKNLCVAIMGCQVNGPGEAKGADIAVAGIGNKVFLYKNGQIYKQTSEEDAEKELFELINSYER